MNVSKLGTKIAFILAGTAIIFGTIGAVLYLSRNTMTSDRTNAPYAGPVEKITIGNIGEYSIFNIIAQDKGLFAKNGLSAEIREYEAGPAAVRDLLAGKLDVTIAADFVGVINFFSSEDLRIIMQTSKHKGFHLVARTDSGIAVPGDLKGKKVGVTKRSAGEFYLGRFLTFNDIALADVVAIDLSPAEMSRRLELGEIDAALIFDPHAYNLQMRMGNKAVSWWAHGEQKTFVMDYSTAGFIENHPDIIRRYVRSLEEAEDFVWENPLEARQLVAKLLNYDPAYVDYMWPNFTFAIGLDQELLLTMEDQAQWAINNGLTAQSSMPNYLDFIHFDALEHTRPELITIIR